MIINSECFSCQLIDTVVMTFPFAQACMTNSHPVSQGSISVYQCSMYVHCTIPISIISAWDKQSHNVMEHWTLACHITGTVYNSRHWTQLMADNEFPGTKISDNAGAKIWEIGLLQSNLSHFSSLTFVSLHPPGALREMMNLFVLITKLEI